MKRSILAWLIPWVIFSIYFILKHTIRWEVIGEHYDANDDPYLLAFWHARILMMAYPYRRWNGVVMVSEHRDGEYIAQAGKYMGIDSVRGSSTQGGARAFLKMIRLARKGHSLGITPDGPKGPAEVVQLGTVQLAKKSGLPLRAVCYATKRYWRAKSWDRFYIPKPFTRGVFIIGEPVYALDNDEETLVLFQKAMDDVQKQADGYFN
jgi:lysophospholipid acyltransferase (LPLAT)-like uncharacterized protein